MADCRKCSDFDWCLENEDCGLFKPKQMTNAGSIRNMSDEELAKLIGDSIDCSICKKEVFETTTCPGSLTADGKDCYECWLEWLKQECTERRMEHE